MGSGTLGAGVGEVCLSKERLRRTCTFHSVTEALMWLRSGLSEPPNQAPQGEWKSQGAKMYLLEPSNDEMGFWGREQDPYN